MTTFDSILIALLVSVLVFNYIMWQHYRAHKRIETDFQNMNRLRDIQENLTKVEKNEKDAKAQFEKDNAQLELDLNADFTNNIPGTSGSKNMP